MNGSWGGGAAAWPRCSWRSRTSPGRRGLGRRGFRNRRTDVRRRRDPVYARDRRRPFRCLRSFRASGDGIRFEVGDAQSLQFADDSFDKALSLLALNFVPDRDTALREMARVTAAQEVLSPAGDFELRNRMEMLRAFWDEAVALDPDAPDERHMPLSRRGELVTAWREQGLHDVADTSLTIAQSFASFDDYWQPFLLGQMPSRCLHDFPAGAPPRHAAIPVVRPTWEWRVHADGPRLGRPRDRPGGHS